MYEQDGNLFVLARRNYPRPILALGGETLNDAQRCTWVTEPLNVGQADQPIGMIVEDLLGRFSEIEDHKIKEMYIGSRHFPSPGGLMEFIQSTQVEIEPILVDRPLDAQSGFSTSGTFQIFNLSFCSNFAIFQCAPYFMEFSKLRVQF